VKRELHVFTIPLPPLKDGETNIFSSFAHILHKGAKILDALMLNDKAVVACVVDVTQPYVEEHRFFTIALGNEINLCVDDVYCGIIRVGRLWHGVFHQPAKTKTISIPEG